MYDRITYTSYLYGDTTAPYLGYAQTNNLIIKHRSDSNAYYQVGNPYLLEETYPEGKAAVRSSDTLYQYRVSLIRNAAALTAVITNQDGDLKDAFCEKGRGIIFTYRGLLGVFRIDYLFHSNDLATVGYDSEQPQWSDHNPVLVDLKLR